MRRWKHLVLAAALVMTPALVARADQEKGDKGKQESGGKKDGGAPSEDDAKGRLAAVDRRIQDEIDKHARRIARIDRVADLAREKKDDKAKADADHLRSVEDDRHKKAMEKLSAERDAAASGKGGEGEKSGKDEHGKGKDDEHGKSDEHKGAPPADKGTDADKDKEHKDGEDAKDKDKGDDKAKQDEKDKGKEKHEGDDKDEDEDEKGKEHGEDHGKGKK